MLNFLINGFGFKDWAEFKTSAFGFVLTSKPGKTGRVLALFASFLEDIMGLKPAFLTAYCVLIIFEWFTGVRASYRLGQPHESRKTGRMIFKIAVYSVPVYTLNQFQTHAQFPVLMGYELDPFVWLYWTVLLAIIWQLLVSLLENLSVLGFKWANMIIKILNKKFYTKFKLDENDNDR